MDNSGNAEIIEQAMAMAVGLQEKGDLSNAEALYRKILAAQPGNAAARFLLSQVEGAAAAVSAPASRLLLEAFQGHQSHYDAVLPYNLNWLMSEPAECAGYLRSHPITVADIGARGGSLGELEGLKPVISYYGFDADRVECDRLRASPPPGFAAYRVFPYYIGARAGTESFNIYRSAGESSKLDPNPRFQRLFNPNLAVDRVTQVESITLDGIIARERLTSPDMIKLDTQGTELEILTASPAAVNSALMVEVEVEFTEMYAGQALFHDVARFMYEHGYELLYLNRVFQNRAAFLGEARGQMTFGDALFGRREDRLELQSPDRLVKYCVLLMNYGYSDIAHGIWCSHEAVRAAAPGLAAHFRGRPDDAARAAAIARDKMLCWQLHRRRTNQLPYESDRSWPIR